jgi:hypothetical protein
VAVCLKPPSLLAEVFFHVNVTVGEQKDWLPMFKITSFGRLKTFHKFLHSIFRDQLSLDQLDLEYGGSTLLRNVGNYLLIDTASYSRGLDSSATPL